MDEQRLIPLAGKKVLIAEDVKSARIGLRAQVLKLGAAAVIEAVDGEQAWQLLQSERDVALAILDWLMPGLDGIEVAERMLADERLKRIPVIMATTRSMGLPG